jgi:hypothetical protein
VGFASLSVGGAALAFDSATLSGTKTGLVVDSGTTFLTLPSAVLGTTATADTLRYTLYQGYTGKNTNEKRRLGRCERLNGSAAPVIPFLPTLDRALSRSYVHMHTQIASPRTRPAIVVTPRILDPSKGRRLRSVTVTSPTGWMAL